MARIAAVIVMILPLLAATACSQAAMLNETAEQYRQQGRLAEAEPLFRQAVAMSEAAGEHEVLAYTLNGLTALLLDQRRFAEAETVGRRALQLHERVSGRQSDGVVRSLINLGEVYRFQMKPAEAEPLFKEALQIAEKVLGPEHRLVGNILTGLASLYSAQGRHEEATALHHRALALKEKVLGLDHPAVALSYNNLGVGYLWQGRYEEARAQFERALALYERNFGPEHPEIARAIRNLADIYRAQQRYDDAEREYRRAIALQERVLGPGSLEVALNLRTLGEMLRTQGRDDRARVVYERVRVLSQIDADLDDEAQRRAKRERFAGLQAYVTLLAGLARQPGADPDDSAPGHAFLVVEQSRANAIQAAMARAATRAAIAAPGGAELARQVEDLRGRRQTVRAELAAEYAKPARQSDVSRTTALLDRARQIDRQLAEATERLSRAFPTYRELAAPEPVNVTEVRSLLRSGEALISFFALDDRLLVWLVRPDQALVYRDLEVSKAELSIIVADVRASLDQSANPDLAGGLLPFDVESAHQISRTLIAPIRSSLVGVRHLLVVPDDLLLQLPLGVLVTEAGGEPYETLAALHAQRAPPGDGALRAYARLSWLAKDHAISMLPSATALRALRRLERVPIAETEPFIGFGDPLLQGGGRERGGAMPGARDIQVLLGDVRRMNRLPGTRDELMAVARALSVDPANALFLGERATKPAIRVLDESGRLGRARVLAFATHGLLAGQLAGLTQPALVLTPPVTPSSQDDGLLRLDDILRLRLHANEWTILSACNTAAPDGSGEGLAGLARAFAYAGAPALLVSHWSVDDRATAALMTEVFDRAGKAPALGRAEALRQGMLALMSGAQTGPAYFAHPFAWAPFFLVGEGAAPRR